MVYYLLLVRVFGVHVLWFVCFISLTIFRFLFTFYSLFYNLAFYLSFNLFSTTQMDLKVRFFFDFISLSFMRIVLFISTIIIIYSFNYIAPYSKPGYFLWITVLFVRSIILVILIPNLMFAILGWDGLGLVSFFLIVYYQNQSSIVSGLFTLLINRLGDRFFLCSLILMFYFYPDFTYFSSNIMSLLLVSLLVLTFITKSALYPFSPWLPIAIAAPTPISALVHSSTLVTAGLYFMIRYRYVLYSSPQVIKLLLIVRFFTSFYAGLNAIFETDFKKLIALSTLRHLGFIGLAFSSGLLHLRFFHLLVHALFKSLLFITIGDIMINLNHSQESRYLSSGFIYTPFSCFTMSISLLNLLGLPSLRGFFSKDLVLETFSFSNISLFLEVILYLNVIFTYYYTYKLFYLSFRSNKLNPYQLFHRVSFFHVFLIIGLGISTLFFSSFFIRFIFNFILFYPIPISIKILPIMFNVRIFIYLFVYLLLPRMQNKLISSYFSSILFLRSISITLSSNLYFSILFSSVKSVEIGFFNYSFNSQLVKPVISVTNIIFISLLNLQKRVFFFTFTFLILVVCSFLF